MWDRYAAHIANPLTRGNPSWLGLPTVWNWQEATVYYKIKNVSCEIEDFIETSSLQAARDTSIIRTTGLCDLIKNVSPFWGGHNLTASCGTQWMCKYAAVDMSATSFFFSDVIWWTAVWGGRNDHTIFGESGKLLLVIEHKIWVGNGGSGEWSNFCVCSLSPAGAVRGGTRGGNGAYDIIRPWEYVLWRSIPVVCTWCY